METIQFKLTDKKAAYISKYYTGPDDVLAGLYKNESDALLACKAKVKKLGWKAGDIVEGREVEYVSFRIDHQDDHAERGLAERSEGEAFVDYIGRISEYFFFTACVCRRFKNPLNNVYTYDDEINGATRV